MTPEQKQLIKSHADAIAEILYADCNPESLDLLRKSERVVK